MSDWVLCRDLRVTLVSARNVEQVGKQAGHYAKVTVGDKTDNTGTDTTHEENPVWNQTMNEFTIPACYVDWPTYELSFTIEIFNNNFGNNQRVGYAKQNIHKLFLDGYNNMRHGFGTTITLPMVNNYGYLKGEVTLTYFFTDQKYVQMLGFTKKMANIGASMVVNAAVIAAFGLHMPTPLHIFQAPDIVNGGSSSNKLSLFGFIAEAVEKYLG